MGAVVVIDVSDFIQQANDAADAGYSLVKLCAVDDPAAKELIASIESAKGFDAENWVVVEFDKAFCICVNAAKKCRTISSYVLAPIIDAKGITINADALAEQAKAQAEDIVVVDINQPQSVYTPPPSPPVIHTIDVSKLTPENAVVAQLLASEGKCRIAAGPEKNCPDCGILMVASIMKCADCGHKF
jgi:hypothetical protein